MVVRLSGGGSSQSSGHIIENSSGTDLTQRDTLKFTGGLKATDDSTNGKTIVDDTPERITWDQWNTLTPAQQQAIPKAIITDAPGVDGPINVEVIKTLWTNPNPNSAFTAQQITLSSNDYDLLLVVFNSHLDLTIYGRSSIIITKGAHSYLSQSFCNESSVKCTSRFIEFYNLTTYNVDSGYTIDSGGTRSVENKCCVPIAIYGIKSSITVDVSGVISDVSTSANKCMMPDGVTSASTAITNLYQYGLNYRDTTNDCDTATTPGFYAINTDAANVPSSEFIYGSLITLGGFSVFQIAISATNNKIAVRYNIGTTWRII